MAKLRKREDRESRSALRICNRKRGGVREGGGVFSLADIRILESDTDMQCTGRTCRDGNSFTRAANFSTFRVERRKVPSSFSSIGNTWKHVAHHRESWIFFFFFLTKKNSHRIEFRPAFFSRAISSWKDWDQRWRYVFAVLSDFQTWGLMGDNVVLCQVFPLTKWRNEGTKAWCCTVVQVLLFDD